MNYAALFDSDQTTQFEAKNLLDAYFQMQNYPVIDISCENSSYWPEKIEKYLFDSKLFVLLSGPSGVGKGPLEEAMGLNDPKKKVVLYTSREPRKGEIDGFHFHFKKREDIEKFRGDPQYIVGEVRHMLQAIDLKQVKDLLENNKRVFVEAYHTLGSQLMSSTYLPSDFIPISVFMSPVSAAGIRGVPEKECEEFLTGLMAGKLKERCLYTKGVRYEELSEEDKEKEVWVRARDAYSELKNAHQYTYVLVNNCGEEQKHAWKNLEADAGRAFFAFSRIWNYGICRPNVAVERSENCVSVTNCRHSFLSEAIEQWGPSTI